MRLPCSLDAFIPALSQAFLRPVAIRPLRLDLEVAYDPQRDQYRSSFVLQQLLDSLPGDAERVVGVVDLDLFMPVLTYVFGEAQLGGPAAVVSTFRLREPWLPRGVRPQLLQQRLGKTLLHELGHTVGLRHCPDLNCVMASAASLEMLDEKGGSFCLDCRGDIVAALG
jgi:archaemetzincin